VGGLRSPTGSEPTSGILSTFLTRESPPVGLHPEVRLPLLFRLLQYVIV
jgi:hypothetical protein